MYEEAYLPMRKKYLRMCILFGINKFYQSYSAQKTCSRLNSTKIKVKFKYYVTLRNETIQYRCWILAAIIWLESSPIENVNSDFYLPTGIFPVFGLFANTAAKTFFAESGPLTLLGEDDE